MTQLFKIILLKFTLIGLVQAEQSFSSAGFFPVEDSPRQVYNFNPGWRFYKGDIANAEKPEFDDSAWESANLPHGLEILGENASGGRNYQGPAWYRKQFSATPSVTGGRTFLYFESIMGESHVWVNGQKVVSNYGGYLPFVADITEIIHADGSLNIVSVKADNTDSKLYPPGQPQNRLDFTYMGGIYRDVYLIQTGPVHVTFEEMSDTVAGGGIFAGTLDVNGNDADMEVRSEITNTTTQPLQLTLRTVLEDFDKQEVLQVKDSFSLAAGSTEQLAQRFTARDVRLWHPDDPYLHFIRTDVLYKGQILDSMRTRIGIRLYEMKGPEGFFINKKPAPTKFIGVNRHQDHAYVGNALPNSGQWRDVKILRQGGSRAIRAAHYPLDPAFYDACDEFGVITSSANPGWHFFNFKNKIFEERLFDDTRRLVRRDRNRPSVVMWETVINEHKTQPDYALKTMHATAHAEYPFPGFYTIADPHEAERGGFEMHFRGTDPNHNAFNREFGDGSEVDNWYSQNARQRVKMEWGENAMLRQTLIQANTVDNIWAKSKFSIGGAMWCGIDHHRGYHPDPFRGGHLNSFRIPRYTYYLYQSQYSPDYDIPGIGKQPMVFVAHELTQLSGSDIVVFSNCDEVRISWLGEEFGPQKPDSGYKGLPHPPFTFKNAFRFLDVKKLGKNLDPAILVAEGIIDGEVVVRVEKPYAQRTTGIQLEAQGVGMDLTADGSDFIPVRATIVDQNGTPKVLASEHVIFEVEGPAEIIGDASTFANPMKTSFGTATAFIRATTKPGTITVKAHSNGLESDVITFESKPAALPMKFDSEYKKSSKSPSENQVFVISSSGSSELPSDVRELQREIEKLRLNIVGQDQEIMELRGQLGRTK
ncbi:MAG: glycoside hydrolase family 2 protein [Opitutales bacterium]